MAIGLLERQSRLLGNPFVFPGKIDGKQLTNPQKAFNRVLTKIGITNVRQRLLAAMLIWTMTP
jgi:hypothetical protein